MDESTTDNTSTSLALTFTLTPDSSLLSAYAYDPAQNMLVLRFKKKGEDTDDKSYGYPEISPERFAEFASSDSLGGWFTSNLKNQYPRGRFIYLSRDGSQRS